MKVLGIIPARGGSKGVPRKNIIDINGKPLICYTIEVGLEAKRLGFIDELVVSTEDKEIADIARAAGAAVLFMRPVKLSQDTTKTVDVVIHAYEFYKAEGVEYDTIIILQDTAPLRTVEDIRDSLKLYQTSGAASVISCYKEAEINELVVYHKDRDRAIGMNPMHNAGKRRQDSPDLYIRDGNICITSVEHMLANHRVIDDVPAMFVVPKERAIDIDSMEDVELVRWKLSQKTLK